MPMLQYYLVCLQNVILNHTDNKDLKNRGDSYAVKW